MIARLIAILFLSREIAHRDHLKTRSFSEHMALNTFYDEIVDLADDLTEMYQGRHGVVEKIPMLNVEPTDNPANDLQKQLDAIEKIRCTAVDKADTAIQNKIDEIVGLFLSTLYKLRNLK